MQSLLDPQVEFLKLRGPDQLVAAIRAAQERVKVTSAHITSTKIDESPGDITETIGVLSIQEATLAQGTVTGWRLEWAPTPDGKDWRLIQIKSLGGPQISEGDVESQVPGGAVTHQKSGSSSRSTATQTPASESRFIGMKTRILPPFFSITTIPTLGSFIQSSSSRCDQTTVPGSCFVRM